MAPGVGVLSVGIALAGASAGYAWTPFNDAVHRKLNDLDRPGALSRISTGTSLGVMLAALASLGTVIADLPWRHAWGVFALVAGLALLANLLALRGVGKSAASLRPGAWWALAQRTALPLFGVALIFGITSAVFISFGAERIRAAGGVTGLPAATAPGLVFLFYGVFGFAGLWTGRLHRAMGLAWLLRLVMGAGALSLALVAMVPSGWAGVVAASGLQGVHVMMTSAVLAIWSERLFPPLPSLGFTAALLAMAAGSTIGPVLAGLLSEAAGAATMFWTVAGLPAAAVLGLRGRHAHDQPILADRLIPV
jgi:predicted MFS family arabinose efflux permease